MKKKRNPLTGALTPTKPTPAELAKAALKKGMGPNWRRGALEQNPDAVAYLEVFAAAKRKGEHITVAAIVRSLKADLGLAFCVGTVRNYMAKFHDIHYWSD